uniref:Uncharacterized protein n=1 Tax=Arundo donax TaxID=35708 RepID=A0A0A9FWE4_ARUDO
MRATTASTSSSTR